MIALAVLVCAVVVLVGSVLLTDWVERLWAGRGSRPSRRLSATHYYEPARQVEPGCCKTCGLHVTHPLMQGRPLDYYRRCPVCAELCDLKGGVSSQPQFEYQGELINETNTRRMYGNRSVAEGNITSPAPDISSYHMERIRR